jgi:hypothetical protein
MKSIPLLIIKQEQSVNRNKILTAGKNDCFTGCGPE